MHALSAETRTSTKVLWFGQRMMRTDCRHVPARMRAGVLWFGQRVVRTDCRYSIAYKFQILW